MRLQQIEMTFDLFYQLVGITCQTLDCRFIANHSATCQLKEIVIKDGICQNFEPKSDHEEEES